MNRVKTIPIMSFSSYDVERRTKTSVFYEQINTIMDWSEINKTIEKYYHKPKSFRGEKPYCGLMLFKMLLIGIWNGLSDVKLEEHVNDSLSASKFCGLQLEDQVPDNSTISRFRTLLSENGALDELLSAINSQLKRHRLIVNQGVKVDASLTQSPFRSKNKPTYEIAEDRKEDEIKNDQKELQTKTLEKLESKGVDKEARYLKKAGKTIFGYKKHFAVDKNGMVLSVHTTAANEHDSKGFIPLLKKTENRYLKKGVYTDKGYKVPNNDAYLKELKIKNRIQQKAYRNRPLSSWQKRFNRLISQSRWVVERTFGSIKRWFTAGITRYKGKAKIHVQHVMEAIAYNLKRSPRLLILHAMS